MISKLKVSVTFLALLVATSIFVSGCEESDADKIADAQACLDKYARDGGGDLAACEAMVEGITTQSAYGIRCATGFIREGFASAQSFIDAFAAIETVNAGSVRSFLRLITFDSAGTGGASQVNSNYSSAQSTYNNCASSRAKGATMIATFAYLTNVLFKYECDNDPGSGFLGSCAMDDAALGFALGVAVTDNSGSTTSMNTDLGVMVVNTHTVSCSNGATNEKLCEFMELAIANAGGPGNKAQVGEEFLTVLANPP